MSSRLVRLVLLACCLQTAIFPVLPAQDAKDAIESRLRILDDEVITKSFSLIPEIDSLLLVADREGSVRNVIMSYLILAKAYEYQKEYDKAFANIDSAFSVAEANDYRELDYMLNYRKSFILVQQGNYTEAFPHLDNCIALASEKENDAARANAILLQGHAFTKTGQLDRAIGSFDQAAEIYRALDDKPGLQRLYEFMSGYYARSGEREKAIEQAQKSLEIGTELKDTMKMIVSHLNLLSMNAILGNVDQAFYHYDERNRLINLIEYPEDRKIDLNIGVLYVQSGRYKEALDVLNICRTYYEKEGNMHRIALIDHWQALAYRGLDRYDLAAEKSKSAYAIADSSGSKKLAELSAFTLFQTYHWRGRDSEAIDWLMTSNAIKDSIESEEVRKEMVALETKYETFRKEQEIAALKAQADIDKARRNQLLIGLAASILLAGLVIWTLITRRRHEKEIEAEKLRSAILEQEKLEEQLQYKEKQLASELLNMAQKNEFLDHLKTSLEEVKKEAGTAERSKLQKVIRTISHDIEADDTWDQFLESFKEVHQSFTQKLLDNFNLTSNEIRLATMMKMNLSSKEIANLLNISNEGVKKARYRLRKKLQLDSEINLQEYILSLG